MARIPTGVKRAWLRRIASKAVDSGRSLSDQLTLELDTAADRTMGGQVIASTSSAGHSVAFSDPKSVGMTPAEVVDFCDELRTLYDRVVSDTGSTDDPTILAEMLGRLQPATQVENDFTNLRC